MLSHLDGYASEIGKVIVAATHASARTETALELAFVADTYLTELDTHTELRGKVANKVAEVDAVIRSEEKQHFAAFESKFRVDNLHIQLAVCRQLLRLANGRKAFFFVCTVSGNVLIRSFTDDGF